MKIAFADLDRDLQAEIDTQEGFEFYEIALESGGDVHVAYHDELGRAGIVYVGSGSSGLTSWTDACSVEDAIQRWENDEMSN